MIHKGTRQSVLQIVIMTGHTRLTDSVKLNRGVRNDLVPDSIHCLPTTKQLGESRYCEMQES